MLVEPATNLCYEDAISADDCGAVLEELLPPLQVDCVSFAFSRRQHIRVPCLLIQANCSAITREAVDALLDFSQRVLDLATPYCVLWDLRGCRTPTAGLVWRFLACSQRSCQLAALAHQQAVHVNMILHLASAQQTHSP